MVDITDPGDYSQLFPFNFLIGNQALRLHSYRPNARLWSTCQRDRSAFKKSVSFVVLRLTVPWNAGSLHDDAPLNSRASKQLERAKLAFLFLFKRFNPRTARPPPTTMSLQVGSRLQLASLPTSHSFPRGYFSGTLE